MRTNDVRTLFRTRESVQSNEFRDWLGRAVEDTEDGDASVCHADVSRYFEEDCIIIGVVGLCCLAYGMGT